MSLHYTYYNEYINGELYRRATFCQVLANDDDITVYLPKYNQLYTRKCHPKHLYLMDVHRYVCNQDKQLNYENIIKEIHGSKIIGTIIKKITSGEKKYYQIILSNNEAKIMEADLLRGFSQECPYIEMPDDSVNIDPIGKNIAIMTNYYGKIIYAMLLTDSLSVILSSNCK